MDGKSLAAIVRYALRTRTRVLGIDPGARAVGLAISSDDVRHALPLQVVDRRAVAGPREHAAFMHAIVSRSAVGGIVVGLPLDSLGREGPACHAVRRYIASLRFGQIPLAFLDERFTTTISKQSMRDFNVSRKRQQNLKDTAAACIILQNALDIGNSWDA